MRDDKLRALKSNALSNDLARVNGMIANMPRPHNAAVVAAKRSIQTELRQLANK